MLKISTECSITKQTSVPIFFRAYHETCFHPNQFLMSYTQECYPSYKIFYESFILYIFQKAITNYAYAMFQFILFQSITMIHMFITTIFQLRHYRSTASNTELINGLRINCNIQVCTRNCCFVLKNIQKNLMNYYNCFVTTSFAHHACHSKYMFFGEQILFFIVIVILPIRTSNILGSVLQ